MNHKQRTSVIALAVTAVTALGLVACAPSDNGAPTDADTLTLGMTMDMAGLGPDQPPYQGWVLEALYDNLLTCDENMDAAPGVAEEWSYSDDRTAVTLRLRDDATFSDGTPVTTDDIEVMVERAVEANSLFGGVVTESADEYNMTITWPRPVASLDMLLCDIRVGSGEAMEAGTLSAEPVGSGPYVYDAAASTVGSSYVMHKVADHWRADDYPYDNVIVNVYENGTAGLNALKSGQIDGILITAATVEDAQSSGLEIVTMRSNTTRLLITDHNGETIPALGDVRVRRAMNMVFDSEAIAEQLYRGYADPAYQIFRPGTDAYIDGLEDPYPYDVEAAQALMAEAGYADGFTLPMPFMEAADGLGEIMPYITDQLALLNITVDQVNLTGPEAILEVLSGEFPVPAWMLQNYADSAIDIDGYILPHGLWNVSHQPDETVDALWQTVLTGTDEERAAAQKEINEYVIDQAWFVPMANPYGFYAHSPEVHVEQITDPGQLHPMLRDFT